MFDIDSTYDTQQLHEAETLSIRHANEACEGGCIGLCSEIKIKYGNIFFEVGLLTWLKPSLI